MRTIALAALVTLMASAAMADPLEGVWQTQPDDGAYARVEITPCGANFCGTIIHSYKDGAEFKSPNVGKMVVIDMAPQGGGEYKGKVWRPSNDKIYSGNIVLSGDSMRLAGCIAGGLLCSKQTWTRLK